MLGWALAAALTTFASALPPRGSDAPTIDRVSLDGTPVRSEAYAGRPIVLLFGELNHDAVRQTAGELLKALAEARVAATKPVAIMVVAQDAPAAALKEQAAKGPFPSIVVADPKRELFAAYHIVTVPSVVVIDGAGKVVHALPGFAQPSLVARFRETVAEAVLVAGGKHTMADLDRLLDPNRGGDPNQNAEQDEHVIRLVNLGRQLTQHGLYEVAQARFAEALELSPGNVAAQLGLADLLLRQERLDDAEPLYRSLLVNDPDSLDAHLGMATLQIRRGGDQLPLAERALRDLLAKDDGLEPRMARVHFALGQWCEKRNDTAGAMAAYRRAAELAIERSSHPVGTHAPPAPAGPANSVAPNQPAPPTSSDAASRNRE
ncbi:MAG: tetratricopeptide repeat protein [Phycisphaerae bacterium]|nr:tetratricopeptide repeat protein [Phycisphaerae bacterium]